MSSIPLGKLPPDILSAFLHRFPQNDPSVILGPGIGLDCAVVDIGGRYLVFKSEPITFVAEDIGWYAVQIACNDIATSGARPRWMLVTMLLPEGKTSPDLVSSIGMQLAEACAAYNITLIGGHTEITSGLDRPILNTTMIGEVAAERLITPRGAKAGDALLLTQSIPVEGTAILAREFAGELAGKFTGEEIAEAQNYLYEPGISVFNAAQTALAGGKVHAMHDPTEGGLAAALHELAAASSCTLVLQPETVPISDLSRRICSHLNVNPFAAIASGALLMAVPPAEADPITAALAGAGIRCSLIGHIETGIACVLQQSGEERIPLPLPERDEIARMFEQKAQ